MNENGPTNFDSNPFFSNSIYRENPSHDHASNDRLISLYLDESLSLEEFKELERRLLSNDSLRKRFLQAAYLNAMLEQKHEPDFVISRVIGDKTETTTLTAISDPTPKAPTAAFPNLFDFRSMPNIIVASIVCTLMLAYFGVFVVHPLMLRVLYQDQRMARLEPEKDASKRLPQVCARVVSKEKCVWSESGVWSRQGGPRLGDWLATGDYAIQSGQVELMLNSGVRTIVFGPVRFSLVGNNEMNLESGRMSARVPTDAIGFAVESAVGRIVDLGTEFDADVTKQGLMDVEVRQGAVEVSSKSAPNSPIQITPGTRIQVSPQGEVASSKPQNLPSPFDRGPTEEERNDSFEGSLNAVVIASFLDPKSWQSETPKFQPSEKLFHRTRPSQAPLTTSPKGLTYVSTNLAPSIATFAVQFDESLSGCMQAQDLKIGELDNIQIDLYAKPATVDPARAQTIGYLGHAAHDGFGLILKEGEWRPLLGGIKELPGAKAKSNQWARLTLRRVGGRFSFFVDQRNVSGGDNTVPNQAVDVLCIGGISSYPSQTFDGAITAVSISRLEPAAK